MIFIIFGKSIGLGDWAIKSCFIPPHLNGVHALPGGKNDKMHLFN